MGDARKARLEDAAAIALVHVRSWQVAYRGQMPDAFLDALSAEKRANMWRDSIQNPANAVFVVDDDQDRVAGFSVVLDSRDVGADPLTAEIGATYVHPDYWRRGFGRALLTASISQARERRAEKVTLWVLKGNERARSFYETFGLRCDGSEKEVIRPEGFIIHEVRYSLELKKI